MFDSIGTYMSHMITVTQSTILRDFRRMSGPRLGFSWRFTVPYSILQNTGNHINNTEAHTTHTRARARAQKN